VKQSLSDYCIFPLSKKHIERVCIGEIQVLLGYSHRESSKCFLICIDLFSKFLNFKEWTCMQHLRGKNDLVGFFFKNGNEGKMKVLIRAFMKILLKLFSF
jgi:hypothetical protein